MTYDSNGISLFYNQRIKHPVQLGTWIPRLRKGSVDDLSLSDKPAVIFPSAYSRESLQEFLRSDNVYVFDNHYHALFCWYEAFHEGLIKDDSTLLHVDLHSDCELTCRSTDFSSLSSIRDFVFSLNNNNFISPAFRNGLVSKVVHVHPFDIGISHSDSDGHIPHDGSGIEASPVLRCLVGDVPKDQLILDIDLDYFRVFETEDESFQLLRSRQYEDIDKLWLNDFGIVKELISKAGVVTIATSPGYIDQEWAVRLAKSLVQK